MANEWDTVDDWFDGDEFTAEATFLGNSFTGIRYKSETTPVAVAAGLRSEVSEKVMVRKSECDAAGVTPTGRMKLHIGGTTFKSLAVELDSTQKAYIIELTDYNG